MQLASLNDRWWDWQVGSWDGYRLVLIADNDLTYHHAVEVRFSGTEFVTLPATFSHPVFRPATSDERRKVVGVLGRDAEVQVFACDAEAIGGPGTFLVAAAAVEIAEGPFMHDQAQSNRE